MLGEIDFPFLRKFADGLKPVAFMETNYMNTEYVQV